MTLMVRVGRRTRSVFGFDRFVDFAAFMAENDYWHFNAFFGLLRGDFLLLPRDVCQDTRGIQIPLQSDAGPEALEPQASFGELPRLSLASDSSLFIGANASSGLSGQKDIRIGRS
jgi:hypothetical protein